MNYPLISEYVEAIKAAEDNFDQLKHLRPVWGEDGEPVMTSGNFAVVFKMKDEQTGKLHAVKCFLKEQEGRAEAYHQIAEELEYVSSTFLTPIKYLDKELFVDSSNSEDSEFPVLLMDWVEGQTLDKYIREHIDDQYEMSLLAYQFSRLAMWLMPQPFAHGDLKPDNILVKEDGTLVLVDYDGMYVPAMKGQKARELGSPDFRHPGRTEEVFDDHIDDFSLASILLSLKAIALQPSLLEEYGASDRLLFSEKDYRNLSESSALGALQPLMQDAELASLYSLYILALSQNNLSQVSFRLFNLSRPDKSQYEEENLSTEVTKEDWLNVWKDKNEFIYSSDKKRLLIAHYDSRISPIWVNQIYNIKKGTKVICNNAFAPYQYYLEKGMFYELNYKKELVSNNCELGSVLIPEGVIKIGCNAFKGCKYLKSIDLPNSVEEIGCSAFEGCESLVSFIIPTQVTEIEESSFKGCSNLTALEIHNDIVEIGTSAFENCSNLTSFIVPKKVTVIRKSVFEGCYNLSSITFSEKLISIGENAFSGCENLTSIVIPEGVQKIGKNAFGLCLSLSSVILPDSLEEIGDYTFMYCQNLQSIIVPNNVTTIGEEAFKGCSQLTEVLLHNSIEIIGNKVFSDCDSLGSIFIPKGTKNKFEKLLPDYKDKLVEQDKSENLSTEVTDEDLANAWTDEYGAKYSPDHKRLFVGPRKKCYEIMDGTQVICDNAFNWWNPIEDITIPDSVREIGESAFSLCKSLKQVLLPASLTKIGNGAFSECDSLKTIVFPPSLIHIGHHAFSHCKSLVDVTLPNSVESLGAFAFFACESLKEISISNSLGKISQSTFLWCKSLKKVVIPSSINSIGDYAFSQCKSLYSIIIPPSVMQIGEKAFYGCESLTNVFLPISIEHVGNDIFGNCINLRNLVIPIATTEYFEGILSGYENKIIEENISLKTTDEEIANAFIDECGVQYSNDFNRLLNAPFDIENYTIRAGTLVICNNAFFGCSSLKSIIIPGNVLRIGDFAFEGCSIREIVIPDSVVSIGNRIFSDCTELEKISIPSTIKCIGDEAFYNCRSLQTITIPEGVVKIGRNPFARSAVSNIICDSDFYETNGIALYDKGRHSLISVLAQEKKFVIPDSVTAIGDAAFFDSSIQSLIIPNSVTSIGGDAFAFSSIQTISIPDSVALIGRSAFRFSPIKSIRLSNNLKCIGAFCFNSTHLQEVVIPDGVTEIESQAFSCCLNLEKVVIPNSVSIIGDAVFYNCPKLKSICVPKNTRKKFEELLSAYKNIIVEQ